MKAKISVLMMAIYLIAAQATQAQAIFDAIKNNDSTKVKVLVADDKSFVNSRDLAGNSPLHVAVVRGYINIAKLLLSEGADLESKNNMGYTPLGFLCRSAGQFETARLLIGKGADINAKDPLGQTPLNNAVMYNEGNKIIDLLLDHKATVDTSQQSLTDMLASAGGRGHLRLFKFIAEQGGEGLFGNKSTDRIFMRNAIIGGSLEIVKLLQAKGIPLDLSANSNGLNPLHGVASMANATEMIEFLIRNGADINARTINGRSAYNIAVANGNKETADLILKLGGNPEPQKFPLLTGPYMGQTPPGNEPKRFAPGIITLDHGTITMSTDGTEIYWGTGKSILMSKIREGKWTRPDYAPFSGQNDTDFYDDVPFITPDNRKLFFTSKRPLGSDTMGKENIWYVDRISDGWSEPKPVCTAVNGMNLHWQISVSASGTLYFSGSAPDSYGASDIYYSKLVNGEYTNPVNMGPVINSKEGESMPFIAPDESYILFYKVVLQRGLLHISFKAKDGLWLTPQKVTQISPYVGAIVSPDGQYFFFYNQWVSTDFIEEMRPKE
ncbi:MAG: ankyrin repeat domain-containing protein [Bacteroidales bacterium]|jgi:ankyrin repeat protein